MFLVCSEPMWLCNTNKELQAMSYFDAEVISCNYKVLYSYLSLIKNTDNYLFQSG